MGVCGEEFAVGCGVVVESGPWLVFFFDFDAGTTVGSSSVDVSDHLQFQRSPGRCCFFACLWTVCKNVCIFAMRTTGYPHVGSQERRLRV